LLSSSSGPKDAAQTLLAMCTEIFQVQGENFQKGKIHAGTIAPSPNAAKPRHGNFRRDTEDKHICFSALRCFILPNTHSPMNPQSPAPEPPRTASSLLTASDPWPGSTIHHQRGTVEQDRGLLTAKPSVRNALLRMVITLEDNFHTREDLLQEAMVYFWFRERQHPGQRLSWYLQGVKFHLNDLRNSGRTIDSPKRRGAQAAPCDNCDGQDEWPDILGLDEGIMSAVNADDICSLLADRLKPIDRTVFSALAEGLGVGDIAEKLKISDQSVKRCRERIAALATKLGVVAPLVS